MKIIVLDKKNANEVVRFLQAGKVIAYPTETVYGLGCDAFNGLANKKIFKIKGRASDKALPVLVSSVSMLKKYFKINNLAKQLINKYWPGPLTLVLDFNENGKKKFQSINKKNYSGAVRISSSDIATKIIKKLGSPLVSTSANPSGEPAALDTQTISRYFKNKKNKPDIIIEGGNLKESKGSTIVDARNGEIKILRQGDLRVYKVKKFIKL